MGTVDGEQASSGTTIDGEQADISTRGTELVTCLNSRSSRLKSIRAAPARRRQAGRPAARQGMNAVRKVGTMVNCVLSDEQAYAVNQFQCVISGTSVSFLVSAYDLRKSSAGVALLEK
jgi:hypothetical protein